MNEDRGFVSVEVPALLEGVRLDRAVAMLTGLSRSAATELLENGSIRLNGKETRLGKQLLTQGGVLEIRPKLQRDARVSPDDDVAFEVVYEDDDIVVVDKPAGLVVHPGAGHIDGTMVSGLLARYPDLSRLSDAGVCDRDRPGIVHRLDRGTSGLMVVARTERAYRSLVSQLSNRSLRRDYVALVLGHLESAQGVIDAPIGRSQRHPTKMAVTTSGKPSTTRYEVRSRYSRPLEATLLNVELKTGRTHQIRVHMAAIGHPVLGDDRYGGKSSICERMFLHARRVELVHPESGVVMSWDSQLTSELDGCLDRLS
ncbi:MAG: RluA family pseudouridine synthase [Actinobacteria bacterium]|nr:RluA family pseudouridine synthase [Actinomycetota bacterium]